MSETKEGRSEAHPTPGSLSINPPLLDLYPDLPESPANGPDATFEQEKEKANIQPVTSSSNQEGHMAIQADLQDMSRPDGEKSVPQEPPEIPHDWNGVELIRPGSRNTSRASTPTSDTKDKPWRMLPTQWSLTEKEELELSGSNVIATTTPLATDSDSTVSNEFILLDKSTMLNNSTPLDRSTSLNEATPLEDSTLGDNSTPLDESTPLSRSTPLTEFTELYESTLFTGSSVSNPVIHDFIFSGPSLHSITNSEAAASEFSAFGFAGSESESVARDLTLPEPSVAVADAFESMWL